ncbi:Guanine nucleotide-binding protein, beta subunit [Trema orientale]|uniref:Guanine nucleotide-binding protein, beta subunit n=1 Tax=Trema orientale TaxID=63057 RepID=A0A2P5CZF0_TREOI|nr:Guanine nucleotide-binding protein, beta subunit [Trema orientale]
MKNFNLPLINDPNPKSEKLEKENTTDQNDNNQTNQSDSDSSDQPLCEWDFNLRAVVSSLASETASDALGVIEFDPSDSVVATGGIARKIRIYRLNSLLRSENDDEEGQNDVVLLDHAAAYDYCICTPAKLSSLRWRPGSGGRVLGTGDYDGVVTEYDLERRTPVFERDEHGGRRVWSVDYSHWDADPVLAASGSDDGTMQMWDPRCEGGECVAAVRPSLARCSVCCVEFSPFGGPLVAVGCADRRAYGYDIRKLSDPVLVLDGHQKTVSYVRFLDGRTMVSAGTDGCLKMWDTVHSRVIRTYMGHVNNRSFVGLSVWRNGGLLGCGSENNQVFVYDKRWGQPIWVHGFGPMGGPGSDRGFVSSVCWRQVGEERCTLVAGGSDGVLQVFVGNRKSSSSSK